MQGLIHVYIHCLCIYSFYLIDLFYYMFLFIKSTFLLFIDRLIDFIILFIEYIYSLYCAFIILLID